MYLRFQVQSLGAAFLFLWFILWYFFLLNDKSVDLLVWPTHPLFGSPPSGGGGCSNERKKLDWIPYHPMQCMPALRHALDPIVMTTEGANFVEYGPLNMKPLLFLTWIEHYLTFELNIAWQMSKLLRTCLTQKWFREGKCLEIVSCSQGCINELVDWSTTHSSRLYPLAMRLQPHTTMKTCKIKGPN